MTIEELIACEENTKKERKAEVIVAPFDFFHPRRNQLLFFFKPECFLVDNPGFTTHIFEMVFEKFSDFKVEIGGALILNGLRLEELSIIDRHYGIINQLSREAGKIVSENDMEKIYRELEIKEPTQCRILGGHEFLAQFPEFDAFSLNDFWNTRHSVKIRSGFYAQQYTVKQENIVLINGFHPSQICRFTNPQHRIVVLLLHSDTDWTFLKTDMAGDTYPERAKENSIRREIFCHHDRYGIPDISVSKNCVHLSAGPFEALYEIDNFLKDIPGIGYDLMSTLIARLMTEKGLSPDHIQRSMSNPSNVTGNTGSRLFSCTEEKNSDEAVEAYLSFFC